MVDECGRLVIVDESYPRCSIASDISSLVAEKAFDSLKAPIIKVTSQHSPVPYAPNLEDTYLPSKEKIIDAVKKVVS